MLIVLALNFISEKRDILITVISDKSVWNTELLWIYRCPLNQLWSAGTDLFNSAFKNSGLGFFLQRVTEDWWFLISLS